MISLIAGLAGVMVADVREGHGSSIRCALAYMSERSALCAASLLPACMKPCAEVAYCVHSTGDLVVAHILGSLEDG